MCGRAGVVPGCPACAESLRTVPSQDEAASNPWVFLSNRKVANTLEELAAGRPKALETSTGLRFL